MPGPGSGVLKLMFLLALATATATFAQTLPDSPKPKPDAQQQGQFPDNAPSAPKNDRSAPQATTAPAASANPAATGDVTEGGQPPAGDTGAANDALLTSRADLPRIVVRTTFVQIPVTVREKSGRLVPGLTPKDFTVLEDGVPQQIRFFTSDPFPLSAAIVINTSLPSTTMKKVNESLPALIGAFSEYDEVAIYDYGHTVQLVSGFTGANNVSTVTLAKVKRPGRTSGPPMIGGGPFSREGAQINGHEADPSVRPQSVPAPVKESYVLNDAILRAAQDLSRRDRTRRRIIFVVSDGREMGSTAHYDEVRKVLLSNNIAVYAMGVDTASLPIYDKLNRVRLPGFGYGNILPKYVSDTAGDMFAEFDRGSIEQAYAKITDVARNQYTLGYYTRATASTSFRQIEVKVHRPGLNIMAKQGYYPLPPPTAKKP
jgi:VWFA-related protein